jgi:MATE family multidrug resistance protein
MSEAAILSGKTPRLRTSERLGELLSLAWPVILARLGIMTMGLTDAIVVGHFSAEQLGFHALAWAPTSIVLTTAVGLLMGVQVMTARHLGEGRPEATGGVLRRGLVYAFWIGVASVVILAWAAPPILMLSPIEHGLAEGAGRAMRIFALSLPLYLFACVGQFWLEALSRPKASMIAIWVANGVNLAVNLWLVPGLSGLPVEGAVASAWATFAARGSLVMFLLVYILMMKDVRAFGVFAKPIDGAKAAFEQFKIGIGSGASYFIEVGAFAGMTFIAAGMGALHVAAWAVVLNVAAIIFMGPLGLSAATGVLVGRSYGAGDRHGVVRNGQLGFLVATAMMVLVCLAVAVWPRSIAGFYSTDVLLLRIAVPALYLSCLFFVADGLQVVAAQALRARGDVLLPTVCHMFSYGAVMLPLGWLFADVMGLGVNGIVWAVIVASLVSGFLLVGRFLLLARKPL